MAPNEVTVMPPDERSDLPRIVFQVLALGALIVSSLLILRPFFAALSWAIMIVVATWPVLLHLQAWLGGRRSAAVAVMTLVVVLVLIVPLYFGITALVDNGRELASWAGSLTTWTVPPPPAWLAHVPLVGERLAAGWQEVAALGGAEIAAHAAPYAQKLVLWFVGQIGGAGLLLLQFLLTVIIAAILYAQGDAMADHARRFARRLAGGEGEKVVDLAAMAVRAVALGVVVTALLQAFFVGVGLLVAAVPFAAILTVITFVLAIAQIGAVPVLIPAVVWVYTKSGYGWGTGFLIWALFCATFDNFLRPMLIQRGANLPLVLIFFGVIGGLIAFGVVGLFIGPVVLAVTYTLLLDWLSAEPG
jgi:predicted PurR-regulated permease PerM